MIKKMKVDGYVVENNNISEVIEKLCEADGSPSNKLSYLADAARLLAWSIAEIAQELAHEDIQNEELS